MQRYKLKSVILILLIFFIFGLNVKAADITFNMDLEENLNRKLQFKVNKLNLPDFNVRGIYVTGWTAGMTDKMNRSVNLVNNTVINAMVIDIKDINCFLSYKSKIGLVSEINSSREKIKDIKKTINRLHNEGIYVIGRIVVFKDKLLARSRPDLALRLHYKNTNKVFISDSWVEPGEKEVHDYNINIAREALLLGFDEIQFDYIRYPALANKPYKVLMDDLLLKEDIINDFVAEAVHKLKYLDKPISIDVFGLTTTVNDDMGIGQNFNKLSKTIDIISPMVYPSHYAPGTYGIKLPENEPYQIVYNSMSDAIKKLSGQKNINIRKWLKDFSIKKKKK